MKLKSLFIFASIFAAVIAAPSCRADQNDNDKSHKLEYLYNQYFDNSVVTRPARVLNIVYTHISNNPSHSCEVVKSAITSSNANKKFVAKIVETAIKAAPSKIYTIAKCAVAVAPDALREIQDVVVKYGGSRDFGRYNSGKGIIAPPGGGKTVIELPIPPKWPTPPEPPNYPPVITPPSATD
jgi:hypothetical protein